MVLKNKLYTKTLKLDKIKDTIVDNFFNRMESQIFITISHIYLKTDFLTISHMYLKIVLKFL